MPTKYDLFFHGSDLQLQPLEKRGLAAARRTDDHTAIVFLDLIERGDALAALCRLDSNTGLWNRIIKEIVRLSATPFYPTQLNGSIS